METHTHIHTGRMSWRDREKRAIYKSKREA